MRKQNKEMGDFEIYTDLLWKVKGKHTSQRKYIMKWFMTLRKNKQITRSTNEGKWERSEVM